MEVLFPSQLIPTTLSVGTGSITIAWVRQGVLYARFCGELSPRLGAAHAARLEELTSHLSGIRYFADGAALTRYDPAVRDRFAQFIRSGQGRFASITLLARNDDVRRVAEPLVEISGRLVSIRTRAEDFERALLA